MNGERILVVDDDRLILTTLAQGLRAGGYEVEEASNGKKGLEKASQNKIDMALLDMRMPEMSGIEIGQQLREMGIPFMFLSAYGDEDIVKQAVSHGAMGYLVKPLDVPQILPSIKTALTRASELRQLKETEENLNTALKQDRSTSVAVGLIMERFRLEERTAFEFLRSHARSKRIKINEIAQNLIYSTEMINHLSSSKEDNDKGG